MTSKLNELLNQKEFLLKTMEDLLKTDDTYRLLRVKNEYTAISQQIIRYSRKGGKASKGDRNGVDYVSKYSNSNPGQDDILRNVAQGMTRGSYQDPLSGYQSVSFKNKVNPRHLKYYNQFKTPVDDHNLLMYRNEKEEQLLDEKYIFEQGSRSRSGNHSDSRTKDPEFLDSLYNDSDSEATPGKSIVRARRAHRHKISDYTPKITPKEHFYDAKFEESGESCESEGECDYNYNNEYSGY